MTGTSEVPAFPADTAPRPAFYLAPHPSTPCEAVRSIGVQVARAPGGRLPLTAGWLQLTYVVEGDMARVRVPRPALPRRTDGLWWHTCFEAFLAADAAPARARDTIPATPWDAGSDAAPGAGSDAAPSAAPAAGRARRPRYFELNFSPSGAWACYGFTGYREGMAPVDCFAPPAIEITSEQPWTLRCAVRLPAAATSQPMRIALAAVIEEADGRLCYWALRHPPGKPDFHAAEGFALTI